MQQHQMLNKPDGTEQPAVKLEDVKKVIGGKPIIKGLSFDIYPGEVFGFLGPNGAGKTTTIRMIVGLMRITEGNIYIHGKSVKSHFKDAIRHVGAIVENPEMYKFLTGYQNLIHYSRMVKDISRERINDIVELVGLKDRINDKVKTYSLGMRQRLGLAQALLHSPSVLILDEPTNGLDPAGIREIRHYIRRLAEEEGLAVIVSSHLLSEMELMCDRIGIIQNGKLVGVQNVHDFVQGDSQRPIRFSVDDGDQAAQIIRETLDFEVINHDNDIVEIQLDTEQIPIVVEILVEKGIKLYGIISAAKTLEDKFLEVTGGRDIV
ncbi:ABC-2 type transport system ATP-binding protein [Scopulibacillus darangshiensis]|uniref:ABC-2 type transport system ATP-binding protein n=1 Tax=Scopulibacillus darangshiensis TaxID=442528 RepID=A0A4R2P6P7_9BACL|nr:ABC transporter ATP-binding protein [Scopulibacillus darangshiensis]TCP30580.1 ABC-2 type transport system ATP-binding protein [Scopulibacillus darangshiensis]